MNSDSLVALADDLVFTQTKKHLTDLQQSILRETLNGQRYLQIARQRDCTEGHIRDAASNLWKLLSAVTGEKIKKSNLRSVLIKQKNDTETYISRSRQKTPKIILNNAPDVPDFVGRTSELSLLQDWIVNHHSRLVTILGFSGIGKTALALKLIDCIQCQFDAIYYRSLRFAPSLNTTLGILLRCLGETEAVAQDTEMQVAQLLTSLSQSRTLIILDDLHYLFDDKQQAGEYKSETRDYQFFLQSLAEVSHNSCILLLSWEKPLEVARLEGKLSWVHSLVLQGLEKAVIPLLNNQVSLKQEEWQSLIEISQGNPLWLKLTIDTIQKLFHGEVTEFLQYHSLILGDGCYHILSQHFNRLSVAEKKMLQAIAFPSESHSFSTLCAESPAIAYTTLQSLQRRCFFTETQPKQDFNLCRLWQEYLHSIQS